MSETLHASPLGKISAYKSKYDPSILYPIKRAGKREELGIYGDDLPFFGRDLWHAYELSWLNSAGKPMVRVARFEIPCDAPCIIESKSFKLYLNSFNEMRFENEYDVEKALVSDLSNTVQAQVSVKLMTIDTFEERGVDGAPGINIDNLDVTIDCYQYNPEFLARYTSKSSEVVNETLHTHLLKSNCPVTDQPDWATLVISYRGETIEREGLLRYICSFRNHQELHEQCAERIFIDLQKYYNLDVLTVYAQYLRRGGLDINPWRSTLNVNPAALRFVRQ